MARPLGVTGNGMMSAGGATAGAMGFGTDLGAAAGCDIICSIRCS
jgi:hypothetical protein